MNKEIRYTGYTAQPSDYDAPDGELAYSLNLINEDGAVKSIAEPECILRLGPDDTVFIHKTSTYKHYIIHGKGDTVSFINENGDAIPLDENYKSFAGITHFDAIGNTLLLFTETAINYFLWKDSSYIFLGNHIPDVDLSFGLIGHPRLFSVSDESNKTFTIQFDGIPENKINADFSEDNKTRITEQVMAKVNKFIRQQTIEKGRFCFPFFVRYALRLYDGTLINHSAPILMNPSTTTCPVVLWNRLSGSDKYTEAELDIMLVAADLDFKITEADATMLNKWSDIVSGVDVYISKPIYTFDQDGKCSSWSDTDNLHTKFIGRLYDNSRNATATEVQEDRLLGAIVSEDVVRESYSEWKYSDIYSLYFSSLRTYPGQTLHLPEFAEDKVAETIRNTCNFYFLKYFDISELNNIKGSRKKININDDYLQSLITREVMTDDYLSHDLYAAKLSYVYNNRLNLSGVYRKPFCGFSANSMFAYCDGLCLVSRREQTATIFVSKLKESQVRLDITTYIKENGRDFEVSSSGALMNDLSVFLSPGLDDGTKYKRSWGCYVFYPNVNAHKMVVSCLGKKYVIALKPHDFLNGAYALLDYETVREDNSDEYQLPTPPAYNPSQNPLERDCIAQPNKLYTSEVNNPFYFPVTGINTVGTGKILGMATAAKALSQGQYGQFPLYAFTEDGVWAMQVNATGTFSAKQPITRDVCINPDGITQIDSAVLFPTARGIMLISGSQTQCISDKILNDIPVNFENLNGMSTLHAKLSHSNDKCLTIEPFLDFISRGGMLYDYAHQRIIVYNDEHPYAFVYSLKTQLWGMMYCDIKSGINSYPDAMAISDDGRVLNFSAETETYKGGILLTRPLKLGDGDILKTVDTVIQRGNFQKGHVQSVLYGSRDLRNWHLVWSSKDHYLRGFRGTPYKYFRMALLCNLTSGESLSGASMIFTPRETNQLR